MSSDDTFAPSLSPLVIGVLSCLIALGYLGAAAFYSPYIGINGQNQIACPMCPYLDVIGGGARAFLVFSVVLGTVNAFVFAAPCIVLLAYRAWAPGIRKNLSNWRVAVGWVSIALTILGWFLMGPIPFFVHSMGPSLASFRRATVVPAIVLGTVSALAMRGKPRVYLVSVGLGMLAVCRILLGLSIAIPPLMTCFPVFAHAIM